MKKIFILLMGLFFFLGFQIDQLEYWTSARRLTWNPGNSHDPILKANGSNVHVFWCDDLPGNEEIYYKRSTNSTYSWSSPKRLTYNSGHSKNHSVCIDSSNLYVAWEDDTPGNYEIFFKSSTDDGINWSGRKRVTYNSLDSRRPVIVNDPTGNLHLVWHQPDSHGGEIYYRKSTDSGENWSTLKRLTWNTGESWLPDIGISPTTGNIIHVVWVDDSSGNNEIYHKKSIDGGSTWTNSSRLTWNTGESISPAVTVDNSGMVFVFWTDATSGNQEILLKRSIDQGSSWMATQRLTWNSGESVITKNGAISGNWTFITWMDSTSGVFEIYYTRTTDSGGTWQPRKRLTWNSRLSMEPAIHSDPATFIIWYEIFSGTNSEIMEKHTT